MRKIVSLLAGASVLMFALPVFATQPTVKGFDENGYNYSARIFSGKADGVDKSINGKVWGDPTYANDVLVMKWNEQWDNCNDHGNDSAEYCAGAWTDNEWNGMIPGGSGETWHYKIIWVGSQGENGPYWREGGYPIWGNYEVILSHGTYTDEFDQFVHYWEAHGTPTGYGPM